MTTYNGHPSYNAWNVSLWINNDEGLYRMALELIADCATRDDAASAMLDTLQECGMSDTPDGAPFTKTNIRRAMVGM